MHYANISPYYFPGIAVSKKRVPDEKEYMHYITYADVIYLVGNRLGISHERMQERTRATKIINAKHILWYLCRKYVKGCITQNAAENVGMVADHSTIIHACVKIENYMDSYTDFFDLMNWFKTELYNLNKERSTTLANAG